MYKWRVSRRLALLSAIGVISANAAVVVFLGIGQLLRHGSIPLQATSLVLLSAVAVVAGLIAVASMRLPSAGTWVQVSIAASVLVMGIGLAVAVLFDSTSRYFSGSGLTVFAMVTFYGGLGMSGGAAWAWITAQ